MGDSRRGLVDLDVESFAGCESTQVLEELSRAGWDKPATFVTFLNSLHLGVMIGLTRGELSA